MTRAEAARPDAIRRHNLSLLLIQIHRDSALTRAELTQRLDLSRSTIRALVADLTDLELLQESVPSGGARAGRPSHLVGPRPNGPYAAAVDLDITHLTTAAVGIGGALLAKQVVELASHPGSPQAVARQVVESVSQLGASVPPGSWPVGIGVSVPGTVSRSAGVVEFAPNLDWRDEPFGAMLAALAPPGLPVTIGNDADLAVLAEHLRGSGRDSEDLIYLLGRIGVGAGIIVNGEPLRGHDGHSGEVGHNVFDPAGPPCHCGKRGCVETYIGENALLRLAGRQLTHTAEHVAAVFTDARRGDECAAAAVRTVAEALGQTVAGLVNVLNPEKVILGGSLAAVLDFAPAEVARSLEQHTMATVRDSVRLCTPGLGEDSALLGAAELAFARLLADPLTWR